MSPSNSNNPCRQCSVSLIKMLYFLFFIFFIISSPSVFYPKMLSRQRGEGHRGEWLFQVHTRREEPGSLRPLVFLQTLTPIAQREFSAAAAEVINCALISLGPSTTPCSSPLLTQLYLISNSLHRPFWRSPWPTTASLLSHLANEKWRQCVGN